MGALAGVGLFIVLALGGGTGGGTSYSSNGGKVFFFIEGKNRNTALSFGCSLNQVEPIFTQLIVKPTETLIRGQYNNPSGDYITSAIYFPNRGGYYRVSSYRHNVDEGTIAYNNIFWGAGQAQIRSRGVQFLRDVLADPNDSVSLVVGSTDSLEPFKMTSTSYKFDFRQNDENFGRFIQNCPQI